MLFNPFFGFNAGFSDVEPRQRRLSRLRAQPIIQFDDVDPEEMTGTINPVTAIT
jgi:hypothetical protein